MQEATIPAPSTNIALLPPAERAAIVLDSTKTEVQLRELVALSTDIVEVKDKAGREQAHRAGMTLKNARVGIEKTGKLAREDAKNFSNAVIAEEKRLIGIVEQEEARIFGLRDGFDAAEAARKAEADRIERERVQGIQAKIESIRNLPHASLNDNAAELAATIDDLELLAPSVADFAEFCPDATAARDTAVAALKVMHDSAVAREAEAARLAAERAELEKLRAEAAERERLAAEQRRQQEQALAAEREALESQRREQEARAAALEADRAAIARHQEEAKANIARSDVGQIEHMSELHKALIADNAAARPASGIHPACDPASGVFQNGAEPITFDLSATPDETAVSVIEGGKLLVADQFKGMSDALRSAIREALMVFSTVEIRAIVEDELAAVEAA